MKLCVSSIEHTYIGVLILIPIIFFILAFYALLECCVVLAMSLICHLCFAIYMYFHANVFV